MNRYPGLVFDEDETEASALERLDGAIAGLITWKVKPFFKTSEQKLTPNIELHRWTQEDEEGAAIDLTMDRSVPVMFVNVLTSDPGLAKTVLRGIRVVLSLPSRDECIEKALSSDDDVALIRAAIVASGEADTRLLALVEQRMEHPSLERRLNAIKASALLRWPELVPVLQRRANRESDPTARAYLDVAAKKCAP